MAQESWKETDETECHKPEAPVLCINNCGFFGSPGTNNLCSKCYRDFIMKTQIQTLMEKGPHVVSSSSTTAAPYEPISQNLKTSSVSEGIVAESSEKRSEIEVEPKKPNRCSLCKKKVGLTGFKCRCGGMFCQSHRYYESHKCSFDYKTAGRDAIAKENPVVMAEKIDKI